MSWKNEPLLVHAGIGSCGFRSYGRGMDETWINHGLASIGAYLNLQKIPFHYLDLRKLKNWRHFLKAISLLHPSIVGISATTVDAAVARKAAGLIKSHFPRIITVIGGIHASVCPEEFEGDREFDHSVVGEGERAFAGIVNGTVQRGGVQGQIIENLDSLPFIDRSIFGCHETPIYAPLFPGPFATFIASRGCPFNCSFCQPAERILFGKRVRSRSPENLVEEIVRCKNEMGIRSYLIHDDCLLWNPDWAARFAAVLEGKNVRLPFAVQARADLICRHSGLIGLLAERGLRMMLIGFESGSQRVLDFLRKGTTVEQNILASEVCRKSGIAVWANYMFGTPGETSPDVDATVRMIRRIRPEVHSPSFFVPYPGTDLCAYCEEQGISLVKDPNDFRRNPEGAKIKNLDYRALRRAVRLAQNGNPVIFHLKKWRRRIRRKLKL